MKETIFFEKIGKPIEASSFDEILKPEFWRPVDILAGRKSGVVVLLILFLILIVGAFFLINFSKIGEIVKGNVLIFNLFFGIFFFVILISLIKQIKTPKSFGYNFFDQVKFIIQDYQYIIEFNNSKTGKIYKENIPNQNHPMYDMSGFYEFAFISKDNESLLVFSVPYKRKEERTPNLVNAEYVRKVCAIILLDLKDAEEIERKLLNLSEASQGNMLGYMKKTIGAHFPPEKGAIVKLGKMPPVPLKKPFLKETKEKVSHIIVFKTPIIEELLSKEEISASSTNINL